MSPVRVPVSCLFIINGLGFGNSTRCHAVIERLAASGCRVHVLTSGNGLAYFEGKSCIDSLHSMESFYYSSSNGGISGWATLKSVASLARIARAKRNRLVKLLDVLNPDVAVIDSEYAISPLRRRGVPIIAINNSEVVVTRISETPAHGARNQEPFLVRRIFRLSLSPPFLQPRVRARSRCARRRAIPNSTASG